MLRLALAAALLLPHVARGGDYHLVVTDAPGAKCPDHGFAAPVMLYRTPAELGAEMERTLTDRREGISGWLSNGFMSYCSPRDRRAVLESLLALGRRPQRFVDESWWDLFVWRARTADLAARVERELAKPALPPRARARFERLRARCSGGAHLNAAEARAAPG